MPFAGSRPSIVACWLVEALALVAPSASAQDRFEMQVFPDENMDRGGTEIEFHSVFIPSGTALAGGPDPSTHTHLSVEVTHGWTAWLETGVFVQTAPGSSDGHAGFTGWHVRPKVRFAERSWLPVHVSLGVEYALFKNPGDEAFRHALSIMPILERHAGRINLTFNPAIDVAVRGPGSGSAPVFEPSASISAQLLERVRIACEYYAETGSVKRFEPLSEQHHLIVPSVDLEVSPRIELNLGIGRGLTGRSEHWVVKSILGYRLGR